MKPSIIAPFAAVLALSLSLSASAQVLVSDTWADGSRNEQNPPGESAWYAASSSTLSASPGSLNGTVGSGSSLWLTYFTPAGTPATLGVGDALRITLGFTLTGVTAAPTTTRGLRIGLFDYADGGARLSGDSFSTTGANGANVAGYMLNMNFAQNFTTGNPFEILERSNLGSANLMGATADFTSLGSGGPASGSAGFSDGTAYTFVFTVTRNASSLDIVTTFSGGSWGSISHMVTDATGPTTRFDAIAIRPANAASAAGAFQFTQFQAEVVPVPEPSPGVLFAAAGVISGLVLWRRRTRPKHLRSSRPAHTPHSTQGPNA